MSRLLFLSHSGIDTAAAKTLKARIVASSAAREHELSVWFDQDDLRAGEPWQQQLEAAIHNSHAFAVYVGSKGVVNWVDAEVRIALNRAITEPDYCFIPILASASPGPEALPGFARQFQGVVDVEAQPEQFDKLMRAVLGSAEAGQLQLETRPFFGLRAIDESRSHLFFGREQETDALVARLHRTPLLLVAGDSGSGKSSLVRAGLVPRFRGGALDLLDGAHPEDTIWHVVTTQPRNQPFRQLGDAVDEAARELGLALADRSTLSEWAASGDIDKIRRALRCDLPHERVQVLLVVDQFEELLTITPPALREPFIDLLLDLSDPADGRHRVVLTMRRDYVNLYSPFTRLQARLNADDSCARFLLGRMSDEGLRRIVTEPLRLAGVAPAVSEALANEVVRDIGERPGDLALVQMALTETWQARGQHDEDLLRAYTAVGRVEGALAQAAERVRRQLLDNQQHTLLNTILLRLVRLGDTGGATRRSATREEFDTPCWELVQTLATEAGKRLVILGGSPEHPTVEIAHEALVTAWPYFQNLLQETADEKRVLDALIPRAQAWALEKAPAARAKRLATGADLEHFTTLNDRHGAWLSDTERDFIAASASAEKMRHQRERRMVRMLQGFTVILLVALASAVLMRERAIKEAKEAQASESRALAALSEIASNEHRYVDAVKLAVAAWPRTADGDRPKLRVTVNALGTAQRRQKQVILTLPHQGDVRGATFNADETRLLTWSDDNTARLWDAATGKGLFSLRHAGDVLGATFNTDETRLLTWSDDNTARLWDIATREELLTLRHAGDVLGATFNADETRLLTWSDDNTARLWDAASGKGLFSLRHGYDVAGAVFNADETRLLTWSKDNTARLWDAASGEVLVTLRHAGDVLGATFNTDETRLLTWSDDNTARLWDAASGEVLLTLPHKEDDVAGAVFNADETRLLTWSGGDTAQLWDAASGKTIHTLTHEGDVLGATFNADETRLLTWSGDGAARLWDAASGKAIHTLTHEGAVWGAAFNTDETRLLTWSWDGAARLWDAASGKAILTLAHEGGVRGAVFNADETRLLTWSGDGAARLWDTASGEAILTLAHEGGVRGAVFNADETRLLTWSGDGAARLWDAASGKAILTLTHGSAVWGAAFNADETRLLTWSGDDTAGLWDAASGEALLTLAHGGDVGGAVFNAGETRLLTWSMDGTARLWDAASGKALLTLHHAGGVWGAAFNADEARLLTWSMDGAARLWDISRLPPGHFIEIACAMLPDHDTSELEKQYGIAIAEPICNARMPAPVWTELEE